MRWGRGEPGGVDELQRGVGRELRVDDEQEVNDDVESERSGVIQGDAASQASGDLFRFM